MVKKISTKAELLKYLGVSALPSSVQALAEIINQLAVDSAADSIVVEDEALKALGFAYKGLNKGFQESFELINQQLEERFDRLNARYTCNIIALWTEIAAYNLSPASKERLLNNLLEKWHEQLKQEKNIFGGIAKIAAVGVVGVLWIAATAVGVKHARPQTTAEILANLFKPR